jgi:uncharacterized protein YbjT (DUF2867 family)
MRGTIRSRVFCFGLMGCWWVGDCSEGHSVWSDRDGGQGVLRECLLDPGVESVLVVGRSTTGHEHAKLNEIVRPDLFDLSAIEGELSGYDACFFCLGVSSAGRGEAENRHLTYDLTLSVARSLAKASPGMTFLYVSGAGTDSTASGCVLWARVKGATENALLRMPFKAAYMFRPGYIQPVHGARTRTKWHAIVYAVLAPLYPCGRRSSPST